jgi:hypothetical protein
MKTILALLSVLCLGSCTRERTFEPRRDFFDAYFVSDDLILELPVNSLPISHARIHTWTHGRTRADTLITATRGCHVSSIVPWVFRIACGQDTAIFHAENQNTASFNGTLMKRHPYPKDFSLSRYLATFGSCSAPLWNYEIIQTNPELDGCALHDELFFCTDSAQPYEIRLMTYDDTITGYLIKDFLFENPRILVHTAQTLPVWTMLVMGSDGSLYQKNDMTLFQASCP